MLTNIVGFLRLSIVIFTHNHWQELAADEEDDKPSKAPPVSSVPQIKHPEMGMVELLEGRIQMYRTASENARAAGDSSKQRRLDRGTKVTLSYI